jgi:hypothetical protein
MTVGINMKVHFVHTYSRQPHPKVIAHCYRFWRLHNTCYSSTKCGRAMMNRRRSKGFWQEPQSRKLAALGNTIDKISVHIQYVTVSPIRVASSKSRPENTSGKTTVPGYDGR